MYVDTDADVLLRDSTVSENTAATAGGVSLGGAGAQTLQLFTVVDNHAATFDQLVATSSNLQAAGGAFGETSLNNGVADCSVAAGQVRHTVSVDGTCRTAHASNQTAPLLVSGTQGVYVPLAASVLKDNVPAVFCTTSDQQSNTRTPFPCDGGAIEQ